MDLARLVGRGGTSGVGVHVSNTGGIVLDGGHIFPDEKQTFGPSCSSLAPPPPLMEARPAPKGCQVVHFRLEKQGISGDLERDFFTHHCPIPEWETRQLQEIADTQLLPAVRNGSLPGINGALSSIQRLGLKAREWSIQGAATQALNRKWRESGLSAQLPLCLSSMGPTLFVLTEQPEFVQRKLIKYDVPEQSISITHPWSGGYLIERNADLRSFCITLPFDGSHADDSGHRWSRERYGLYLVDSHRASRDSTAECLINWMFTHRSIRVIVRDRP
jgi:beta-RFAP synthase